MIVITGCQRVGTLMQNCDILRATTFQILPIARNTNGLSSQQLDDEQAYIHLLQSHLKQNGFYFSHRYHITLSVQKQAELTGESNDWREVSFINKRKKKRFSNQFFQADTRFFWNRYLCEKMITATLDSRTNQDVRYYMTQYLSTLKYPKFNIV